MSYSEFDGGGTRIHWVGFISIKIEVKIMSTEMNRTCWSWNKISKMTILDGKVDVLLGILQGMAELQEGCQISWLWGLESEGCCCTRYEVDWDHGFEE